MRLAAGLIDDPARIVRIKAARALAVAQPEGMGPEMKARLDKAFAEYVASQRANADRPEAHMNLGLFYVDRRDPVRSEAEYRAALALQPNFIPAFVNLADLYRAYKRDADAEAVLTEGLQKAPGNADLSHALGLLRVREGHVGEALPLLADAARANPANERYAYVYGIALHDSGQEKKGIMNDVIDSQGYAQAAWWNRIPAEAWGLMGAIALLANILLGYTSKTFERERLLLMVMPHPQSKRGSLEKTVPQ